jgi:hypothetical protein
MIDNDLSEILNNRNAIGMRIFLNLDEGVRFIGTVRQYELTEAQNVFSLFFANSKLHAMFDLLFGFYMIPNVKFDGNSVTPNSNLILLNAECQEKITKIRPGILELLRVHGPSLERESLTEKTITYFPEPIRLNQLSIESLSILHNSWRILNEAEVSEDCEAAVTAILAIADIYERESVSISDRHGQNAGMAKTLETMSSTLKILAPEVKRKHTSISIANHYAQLNHEVG